MTGRGIDQILPYPNNPVVYEPYVKDAREYVKLAEEKNGEIPKPVNFDYIWGDALNHLERLAPDLRIINLETSITASEDYWRGKQINYRMNPKNAPCLTAAKIDCCSLANNHVLDWGFSGLQETLETLREAGIKSSGAGKNLEEAESPELLDVKGKGRIIFFSFGSETSGVPTNWAATENKLGINLLKDLSSNEVHRIKGLVERVKQQNDIVVVSIHWGSNWGYEVLPEQRLFAHKLIDKAGVDLIHGHSSHHAKGIEVYENKLILYGCGDFLNDYEGIGSYEFFRGDLGLMYFAGLEPQTGKLCRLEMIPTQIKHFKVNNASGNDALWLSNVLNYECEKLGCSIELNKGFLSLKWS
jgi:poly-gamma-glutamate capsule biosynthesis protein CapA/YwtB (metallophosphatase superfamily)